MAVLPPDPVFTLRCPEMGSVNSICFHDNHLLAGTQKGSVYLFDLQTNRSVLNFEVGTDPITSIHHSEDLLITQEKGGKVCMWRVSNSSYVRLRTTIATHLGFCRTMLYKNTNNGDSLLFYPCDEGSIGIVHINDHDSPSQFLVPNDPQLAKKIGSVTCFKPFERASEVFLLAGYESGYFLTWDLSSGSIVDLLKLDTDPLAIDFDPWSNRGIIGGASDTLTMVSYNRQSMQLQKMKEISIKNAGINCIRIREDQKVFATGGWDGRIRIFSWKSLRPLAVLTQHKTGGIMDIAFSKDKISNWNAPIMAAAGMDGQISLWDLYN